jgi:thymidine phosphorylase
VIEAPVGARVKRGDPLVTVHARSREVIDTVRSRIQNAWRIVAHEVRRPPHVLARVDKSGVSR